jgi:putative ABC transport system permease protein
VARQGRQPLHRTLIVAEVALTLVVATGAGLLLQSFTRLVGVDSGFTADGVIAADVTLPATRYATAVGQRQFVDALTARIAAIPGVSAAAATNLVPQSANRSGIGIAIEGRPPAAPGDSPSALYRIVSPDYFTTLGVPIVAGRSFRNGDARVAVPLVRWFPQQPLPDGFAAAQAAPAAVINESMARRFWPGEDPIGRRFTVLFSPPIAVIGVVRDTRDTALAETPDPEFYLDYAQEPASKMTVLARAPAGATTIAPAIRAAIWAIDRDLPASAIRPLPEILEANLALYRLITALMGVFATMALLLMSLGVYAVMSYMTAQRLFEIGVRLALGAQRRDIRALMAANSLLPAAAGILLGAAGAYGLARLAGSLLYEVTPADPLTYATLAALVLAVTAAATWAPARRAQRVDPVQVLRSE